MRIPTLLASGLLLVLSSFAAAQPAPPPDEPRPDPAIRRWLDVQHLHLSSRYRWIKASDDRLMSSTVQWQPQVRARVLFDRERRYSLHVGAFSGSQFISGWNNTGGGIGQFTGDFNVKQLFFAAAPVGGIEIQAGGLYMLRGQSSEVTTYDNDAYIVGERVSWRPSGGWLTEVSATAGYIGDYREPNVFKRLDRLDEWNYGQVLVGWRMGARMQATAEYTHEDGREFLRQGLSIRLPASTGWLRAVRLEAYERVSPDTAVGANATVDLRPHDRLSITAGLAAIDEHYGPLNADRYEVGTRFYSIGSFALTPDVSIGWFHGRAFATSYPIPNRDRFELLVTINPTATLKARRVF